MLHCQCLHVTQIRLIFQFNNEVLSMILFRLFYIIGVCLCFKHRRNQRTGQSKLTLDLKFTYFLSNGKNKCQKWSNYKLYHETNGLWLRSTKSFADDSKQDLSCWEGLYVGLLRKIGYVSFAISEYTTFSSFSLPKLTSTSSSVFPQVIRWYLRPMNVVKDFSLHR